jgi:lysophospholipase L1-like esterase
VVNRKHIGTGAGAGLAVLLGLGAATAGYAVLRLRAAARVAARARPFEHGSRQEGARLLVVGDSTAAGAGASAPACSLPGLLARANPSLSVVNRARPGAGFAAMRDQLDANDESFDAVLILGGASDVLGRTPDAELRELIAAVAQRARVRAELVVFMPPGNLGSLPFLLPPWNWWMSYRARRLQAIVAQVAQANGALHVSLFRERADDPFARHPRRLAAPDGLHPSDAGYELWQRELEAQVQLSAKLRRIGRQSAALGAPI